MKLRTYNLVWPEPSWDPRTWAPKYRHRKSKQFTSLLCLLPTSTLHEFKELLPEHQRKHTALGVTEPGHWTKPLLSWDFYLNRGEDNNSHTNKNSTLWKPSAMRKPWLHAVRTVLEGEGTQLVCLLSGSQTMLLKIPSRGRTQEQKFLSQREHPALRITFAILPPLRFIIPQPVLSSSYQPCGWYTWS